MTALKATEQASLLGTFVPPGVVMPFAGATAPSGWLLCDGREVSQTTYASLYAAIGTTYNTQIDPTSNSAWAAPSGGNFRIPDYRGIFLRGKGNIYQGDNPSTLGGFQTHATRKNGLGGSTDTSGAHHHALTFTRDNARFGDDYAGGGIARAPVMNATHNGSVVVNAAPNEYGVNSAHSHALSISDGDNETRPHNKAVNYIIKY